jgi:hypothetical protein
LLGDKTSKDERLVPVPVGKSLYLKYNYDSLKKAGLLIKVNEEILTFLPKQAEELHIIPLQATTEYGVLV